MRGWPQQPPEWIKGTRSGRCPDEGLAAAAAAGADKGSSSFFGAHERFVQRPKEWVPRQLPELRAEPFYKL
ncbi:hypothetical protein KZ483_26145 [Paenibacillus sp. sptzw28]|uniref:hypothetical protein n=1 Tax=Paenibacillus sp. sptzw28 TaxID=715179 RepID=UPI001C6EF03B|nr:hypothetical protein [Paenibacillus sp. sptzw28]QYR21145.1 hypothetical protein KZ483_26145 [Paenibacillus sp. sptzw28]